MAFGKKNHVKIDPLAYNIMVLGEPKIGKTTLIYEVCKKLTGEEGYLFLETGYEEGADAIEGINYINCPTWETQEDEDNGYDEKGYNELRNEAGFINVINDIVRHKVTDYPQLRVVIIDTYDNLISMAEEEAIRLWNYLGRSKDKFKNADSINEAWGGFQKGQGKTIDLILDAIFSLKRVGVNFIIIGHVKTKDKTDVWTGNSYTVLTSDVQQRYFNALFKDIHICGLAYKDRSFKKVDTGKENIVTKKKEQKSYIEQESRKINFRDNSFVADNGGRFANIVPEIEFGVDNFINAIVDAIKAEQKKSGSSYEESKKQQQLEEAKKADFIAQREMKQNEKKMLDETIERIINFIVSNKSKPEAFSPLLKKSAELGYEDPRMIDSIEVATAIAQMITDE